MAEGDEQKGAGEEDQHFVQSALRDGLMSQSQIDECIGTQQRFLADGEYRTLAEIAAQKTMVSQAQADQIEKSSLPDHVPKMAGNYEILRKIGEGGMGTVYKARHVKLDSFAAVKFLPAHLAKNEGFVRRFEREAKLAAQLNSPHSVRTFDVAEVEGARLIMMEYVEGESLDGLLRRDGRLDEKKALRIVRDVAGALQEAHEIGIIHRDIKPANILLTRRGVPKVADLGLAKNVESRQSSLTSLGSILGTPSYMSPEQAMGLPDLDARSDIFSLGATFYRMVTGDLPFKGETPVNVMHKIATEPLDEPLVRNPDLSRDTAAIICKMMAKDRQERYQSMEKIVTDIEAILSGEKTGLKYEQTVSLLRPTARAGRPASAALGAGWKRKAIIAGGAAVVLIAVIIIASRLGLFGSDERGPARQPLTAADMLTQARSAAGNQEWEQSRELASKLTAEFPNAPEAGEAKALCETAAREIALKRLVQAAAQGDVLGAAERVKRARKRWPNEKRIDGLLLTIEARLEKAHNEAVAQATAAEKKGDFTTAAGAYKRALTFQKTAETTARLKSVELKRDLLQAAKTTDIRAKLLGIADLLAKSGDAATQPVQTKIDKLIGARSAALTAQAGSLRFQKHMPPDAKATHAKAEAKLGACEAKLAALDPLAMTAKTLEEVAGSLSAAADLFAKAAESGFDALYPDIDKAMAGADFAAGLVRLHAARAQHPDFLPVKQLIEKHDPKGVALAIADLVAAAGPRKATYESQQEAADACKKLDEAWGRCAEFKPKAEAGKKPASLKLLILSRRAAAQDAAGSPIAALVDATGAAELAQSEQGVRDLLSGAAAHAIEEFGRELKAERAGAFVKKAGALVAGKDLATARRYLARAMTAAPFTREFMRDGAVVAAWSKAIEPFHPAGMVGVPGGTYALGLKYTGLVTLAPSSSPEHAVKLAPFFIGVHEVTNEEFQVFVNQGGYMDRRWWAGAKGIDKARFVDATGKPGPRYWRNASFAKGEEKLPVVGVSFYEAAAYAHWAGKRLPTEAEWECAALGVPPSGKQEAFGKRAFPWGDKYVEGNANLRESGVGKPEPVGARPKDRTVGGSVGMVGNVREWTASEYDPYAGTKCKDKHFGKGMASVRGAGYADSFIGAAPTTRRPADKDTRDVQTGFRCAWALSGK